MQRPEDRECRAAGEAVRRCVDMVLQRSCGGRGGVRVHRHGAAVVALLPRAVGERFSCRVSVSVGGVTA
jgi:hypothetical protein